MVTVQASAKLAHLEQEIAELEFAFVAKDAEIAALTGRLLGRCSTAEDQPVVEGAETPMRRGEDGAGDPPAMVPSTGNPA